MSEENQEKPQEKQPKSVLTEADKRKLNLAVLNTETSVMNPIEYEQQRKIAQQMFGSQALPEIYKNVDQVFMAIQIGHSAGLTPYQAITYGYFIDGKYNIYGMNVPTVIRKAGYTIRFYDESDEACSAELMNKKTGEQINDTFTYQEAVDSGYTQGKYGEKFGWKKGANRRRKLRYGVLSLVLHTQIPHVMGGIAGVIEFSNDYLEGQVMDESSHDQQTTEDRKARMQAAEASYDPKVNAKPLEGLE